MKKNLLLALMSLFLFVACDTDEAFRGHNPEPTPTPVATPDPVVTPDPVATPDPIPTHPIAERETHWIKISTGKFENTNEIQVALVAGDADKSGVWIDLNGNGKKDDGESISTFNSLDPTKYTITSDTIVVYGKITNFSCTDSKLSYVDISKNDVLEGLNCAFNEITSVNISGAKALNFLAIQGNKITDEKEMQSIVDNLPVIPASVHSQGTFKVVRNQESKENTITRDQVKAANSKNWNVLAGWDSYKGEGDDPVPTHPIAENETHWIKVSMEKFEDTDTIQIAVQAEDADKAGVWADFNGNGTKDDGESISTFSSMSPTKYIITSDTIVVYGKITDFTCHDSNINTVDVSNNAIIEKLNCAFNKITSINISGTKDLNYLAILGNNIKDEKEMQNIIDNLPDRSSITRGQFRVVRYQDSKENKITKDQVQALKIKNWRAMAGREDYAGE